MLEVRTKIGAGGRVIIPSVIREKLHLSIGDEVIVHIKNDELQITTLEQALLNLQEKVKRRNKHKISLVDDLLSNRHKEALNE